MSYVSRAGEKLAYALQAFGIDVRELICADFGSNTGGFSDCLLQGGAARVYAVDTGYGVLDWKLRNDPRIVAMERENAIHIRLPEKADLITIDVGWTRLNKVIPNAINNLKSGGQIVALLKPHYESDPKMLRGGKLKKEFSQDVVEKVRAGLSEIGAEVLNIIKSPLLGKKGENEEFLLHIKPKNEPKKKKVID